MAVKRVLALSGGGVRGIIEVAFLEAIERVYQERRGPDTRLSDVFDLVGGTSTGALIAAAVTLGKPISEIADFYLGRATRFFRTGRRWMFGVAPIFDAAALEAEIREEVGDLTLGAPELKTYLAVVLKRLDTGSPWVVSNLPHSPYFDDTTGAGFVANKHFPLSRLLRASSAAPTYFRQQELNIVPGEPPGVFVDGGASPFNDPSVALLMLARMQAFGLNWPLGTENLFILSIGTGRYRMRIPSRQAARLGPLSLAIATLKGLISDNELHALTLMEWFGQSLSPVTINSEIGSLADDHAFGQPQFSFLRLDVPLDTNGLAELGIDLEESEIKRFHRIDDPTIIRPLYELTREVASRQYDLASLLP